MTFNLTYKPYGARAILIEWPAVIDEVILKDIIRFSDVIERKNIKEIVEIKTAYNSLLVIYESVCRNYENEVEKLKNYYFSKGFEYDNMSKLWKIPVCYDAVFGIDLEAISLAKNISKEAIIERHSQVNYTVFFIGFLPGFLYLGGLDELLYFPRKETPKLSVKKGAVAIGGNQTGVYPNESPGGWNIIGNTPISFFDIEKSNPCFAKSGDCIKFHSVTIKEYHNIKKLVDTGVYQMESEVIDG